MRTQTALLVAAAALFIANPALAFLPVATPALNNARHGLTPAAAAASPLQQGK